MRATRYEIARFLVIFELVHVSLFVAWGVLASPYAAGYRAGANSLARLLRLGDQLELKPLAQDGVDSQIVFKLTPQPAGRVVATASVPFSVRNQSYVFSVFFVALALATPSAWSRRFRTLACGMVLLSAYCFVSLVAKVILLAEDLPSGWPPVVGEHRPTVVAIALFFDDMLPWYLPPVFIWLALSGRDIWLNLLRARRVDATSTASDS